MKRLQRRNRQTGDGRENRWENLLDLKPQSLLNSWPPIAHHRRYLRAWRFQAFSSFLGWLLLKSDMRRFLAVSLGTFLISLISNYTSNTLLDLLPFLPAFGILLAIIMIGILFDIIGVATTAASEVPYHAMAADKVVGAKQAMWVVRNAASLATLCNDMIGDIAGTLSGAVGTSIAFAISREASFLKQASWVTLLVSAVAAITVGGKALGKNVAIQRANDIVYWVGKVIYGWETITGLRVTSLGNTVGTNKKRGANGRQDRWKKAKQGD